MAKDRCIDRLRSKLDRRERPKLVRYWVMKIVTGTFVPTTEVDAIAWVRPSEAVVRLSHEHDRELLAGVVERLAEALERRECTETLSLG